MNKFVAGTNDVKKRNFSVHIKKVFRIWTQAKAWIKLYKDLPTKVLWLHLWKECIKNWTINWWWNFNWHISLRFMENLLTLSWRRSLSYRNQFIDLLLSGKLITRNIATAIKILIKVQSSANSLRWVNILG